MTMGEMIAMKIYLIRHSITEGNLKKRYIGRTDEPLCPEGEVLLKEHLAAGVYPEADKIFVSPMKRCIQTARILYPSQELTVIDELSECDFGTFENKNYEELKDLPEYQKWLQSGGAMRFPEGESKENFTRRSLAGFERALLMCGCNKKTLEGRYGSAGKCKPVGQKAASELMSAVFVVHGGTIMSIMERYAVPKGTYYDFQTGNGEGYELILADGFSAFGGIYSGLDTGRSGVALSSGADDRTFDCMDGKNYKKLSA